MNPALLNAPPRRSDVELVYRDLIYCLQQAFALTCWYSKALPEERNDLLHDALLEASLLNIRNLDYFLARDGSGADVSLHHVRQLGFSGTAARILTDTESRIISQLFAHITANRNVDRTAKEGFPLGRYLATTVASFDPILGFYQARSKDTWEADNIRAARHFFAQMLDQQKKLDAHVHQKGLHFYVSGNYFKVV